MTDEKPPIMDQIDATVRLLEQRGFAPSCIVVSYEDHDRLVREVHALAGAIMTTGPYRDELPKMTAFRGLPVCIGASDAPPSVGVKA